MNLSKKTLIAIVVAFAIALLGFAVSVIIKVPSFQETALKNGERSDISQISNMNMTSSAFENNSEIPSKYTCDGENISPPLTISDVTQGTQSLVLIVDDPDAPTGDWVHWLVWNINPDTGLVKEGEVPQDAIQGLNDFGKNNYGGPCPPSGTHRYQFKLYALDTTLDLPSSIKKEVLEDAIQGHILEQIMLIGKYSRN